MLATEVDKVDVETHLENTSDTKNQFDFDSLSTNEVFYFVKLGRCLKHLLVVKF